MKILVNSTVRCIAIASIPTLLLPLCVPIYPATAKNPFDGCVSQLIEKGIAGEQAGTACADALVPKDLSKCVSEITEETSIDPQSSLKACYQVRRPVELADCVVNIYQDALQVAAPAPSDSDETSSEVEAVEETDKPEEEPNNNTESESTETETPGTGNKQNMAPETTQETPSQEEVVQSQASPSLLVLDSCRRSLLPKRYAQCVIALKQNIQGMIPETAMTTCLSAEDFPRDLFPTNVGE